MTVFRKKCIIPEKRVCYQLKNLRLAKKISLEEMEKCTKINKEYLEALENCEFEKINVAKIYQKNFIKKYLICLGEEPKHLLKQFEEEEKENNFENNYQEKKSLSKRYYLSNLPAILRYLFIFLIIFSFGFYIWSHVNNILKSPTLIILSPQDGIITNENNIHIIGKTEKETKININKENIKINEQGVFDQAIILSPGINTIVITAESKHGKTTKKTLNIFLK